MTRNNYIYARVNTYEGKASLEQQILELKNYALENSIKIDKVYGDLGPAGKMNHGYSELVGRIHNSEQTTVICSSLDRLVRRVDDMYELIMLVESGKLEIRTINGVVVGTETFLILSAIQKTWLDIQSAYIKRGLLLKKISR